jgi:hypothetical protein
MPIRRSRHAECSGATSGAIALAFGTDAELNFIRRYGSTWDPSGNHVVPIVAAPASRLQHQSGR